MRLNDADCRLEEGRNGGAGSDNWLATSLMIKGRILSLVIVGLVCVLSNGCRAKRANDRSSETSAQRPTADSTKPSSQPSPITWQEVASSYERVTDYVCVYEKVERAISKGEQQTIRFSFRKPLDVRMEWVDIRGNIDQTAVYRQGLNDGKVLARQNSLLGMLAGKLRLDPNESLALSDSRHPITEVGIGKIIDRAQHDAATPGVDTHFVGEEAIDGRPAYNFEFAATGDEAVGGLATARKAVIWIDRGLKLPIKLELYDSANTLLERHQFKQVRVNQKLGDKVFTL